MKANSVIEFLKILEKDPYRGSIFRGHAVCGWQLIPSLGRIDVENLDTGYGGWAGLEGAILDDFELNGIPHLEKKPASKLEWMIHAQHFGVPTRLLDWTTNPLKALFFTVSDVKKHYTDGAVFHLMPGLYINSSKYMDCDIDVLTVFHPIHINKRIMAQDGCFTLFPLPDRYNDFVRLAEGMPDENSTNLEMITIPGSSKMKILVELLKLGISFQSIFPGIDGVARTIKNKYATVMNMVKT